MISLRALLSSGAARIGPGRLILVVGPSGAGKDTLISGARAALLDDPQVVFPRRVVTRASSEFEQHESLSELEFDRAVEAEAFAFWWEAHGHRYGIPKSIDADVCAGRTVVCNVSRAIVEGLREDYARVVVVLVTASPHILAERRANRGRASDGNGGSRLQRESQQTLRSDFIISNTGVVETGVRALVEIAAGRRGLSDFPVELL